MIKVTAEGPVIYRAGKIGCLRFPNPGDERLREGQARNFQAFYALELLAEVVEKILRHCGLQKEAESRPPAGGKQGGRS